MVAALHKHLLVRTLIAALATVVLGLLVLEAYRRIGGLAARRHYDDPDVQPPLPPVPSYALVVAALATTGVLLSLLYELCGKP